MNRGSGLRRIPCPKAPSRSKSVTASSTAAMLPMPTLPNRKFTNCLSVKALISSGVMVRGGGDNKLIIPHWPESEVTKALAIFKNVDSGGFAEDDHFVNPAVLIHGGQFCCHPGGFLDGEFGGGLEVETGHGFSADYSYIVPHSRVAARLVGKAGRSSAATCDSQNLISQLLGDRVETPSTSSIPAKPATDFTCGAEHRFPCSVRGTLD